MYARRSGKSAIAARFGAPCQPRMSWEIGMHRPQAGGEHAGEISPERAREREHRQDRRDREHPDPVGEHARWLAAQLEERAIEGRHARVLAERHPEHPEGVVEEERAVAGDLVGVEEVLGPVVSGNRVAADHALLEQHADGHRERQAGGRRQVRPHGRARPLGPGERQADHHEAREREPHDRAVERRAEARHGDQGHRRRREPERRASRQHGHGALADPGGQKRSEREPGRQRERGDREQRRGGACRAEQRLDRDDRDRAQGQRPSPQPTQHRPEYRDREVRCDSHSA